MVETQKPAPKSSFLRLLKAVFWSFFGVRRRRDLESDATLNPLHLIAAGIIGAVLFIVVLLVVVRAVVG
ncbi:DUF2970 domain-containing protein [Caballeronia mineralivorans]|jgi:hypothetical protein|uniref:DUF2970 domain-containing protein n=1 Tax=Caballeronia mineralivorans TaxID=2010198 RepID=UPI000EFC4393|nr:DUF2970 domain-containing protein [Caballeronia mineralivorans]MDB5788879.1 hypothetical protein [Caballeronia mineralivorans]MEA3096550.1 hypothetical protein [Caballeronia mineralivorans]